jgi:starch synthase
MRVLFVSPELDPFVKVGGLADMVGALPKELCRLGLEVRIICPLHGSVKPQEGWNALPAPLAVHLGHGTEWARVWEVPLPGASEVKVWFLENWTHFARPEVYAGPWGSHADNDRRFTFLSRAALDLCLQLPWIPDVIHCHDWTTGFIPVYLNTSLRNTDLGDTATVFSIHNLEHQGYCDRSVMDYAGLPWSEFRPDSLEAMGAVNMMKAGIYHSTKLSTVSPTYANEITTAEFGCGLDPVLRFRSGDLIGILNGIDDTVWNPATDRLLPANYSADDLSGKAICKTMLQREVGLTVDPNIPVFGVVSRLYGQKGLDLLAQIADGVLAGMLVQFVILGSGEQSLVDAFHALQARHPGRFAMCSGYNNRLAHLIEAGSDFFLMPSRFEPCGLNQMYSMRYGTPPIVRATGGLLDTVDQYREGTGEGTGFIFDIPSAQALYYTIGWACSTYYDRKDDLHALRLNGMRKDFTWTRSAKKYAEVYKWAVDARRWNRVPRKNTY